MKNYLKDLNKRLSPFKNTSIMYSSIIALAIIAGGCSDSEQSKKEFEKCKKKSDSLQAIVDSKKNIIEDKASFEVLSVGDITTFPFTVNLHDYVFDLAHLPNIYLLSKTDPNNGYTLELTQDFIYISVSNEGASSKKVTFSKTDANALNSSFWISQSWNCHNKDIVNNDLNLSSYTLGSPVYKFIGSEDERNGYTQKIDWQVVYLEKKNMGIRLSPDPAHSGTIEIRYSSAGGHKGVEKTMNVFIRNHQNVPTP